MTTGRGTGTSFEERSSTPIVTYQKDQLRGMQSLLEETEALPEKDPKRARASEWRRRVERIERIIAKRTEDPRYRVEVKFIGTLKQPYLFSSIVNEERGALHQAELRAKEAILKETGSMENISAELVGEYVARDQMHTDDVQRSSMKLLQEGLVTPDLDLFVAAILQLGGGKLLSELVYEVRSFQEMSHDEGEV